MDMKKLFKIALLMVSMLVSGTASFAARQGETTLRGTVIDATGAPAGFATAYLSLAEQLRVLRRT